MWVLYRHNHFYGYWNRYEKVWTTEDKASVFASRDDVAAYCNRMRIAEMNPDYVLQYRRI